MANVANNGEYKAPALEKGLDILELLSQSDHPLTKRAIAGRLNRSVNEIFRMLSVLEGRRYISSVGQQGAFELTFKLFELSNQTPYMSRLLHEAGPLLEGLCRQTRQSCHVSVYHNGSMLVIAGCESPCKMGFGLRLGGRIDILGSGSGAVLLAYSDAALRSRLLQTAQEKDRQRLARIVTRTLTQGYIIEESPQVAGITNISYPIFSAQRRLEAVITIPFMTMTSDSPHKTQRNTEHSRTVLETVARQLTELLGGSFHL